MYAIIDDRGHQYKVEEGDVLDVELMDLAEGQDKIEFDRVLTAPEGLGPVFNKNSCGNCHSEPLGGPGNQTVTRFGLNESIGALFGERPDSADIGLSLGDRDHTSRV